MVVDHGSGGTWKDSLPEGRLIPITDEMGMSHVWWTSNPKVHYVHSYTNTCVPPFVFFLNDVDGGGLIIAEPEKDDCSMGGMHVIDTTAGNVVGRLWAQYLHANEKCTGAPGGPGLSILKRLYYPTTM